MNDEKSMSEKPPEREWPVNRVFLPEGVIGLAAVSPELENGEGVWWVRESSIAAVTDERRVAELEEFIRETCAHPLFYTDSGGQMRYQILKKDVERARDLLEPTEKP